MYNIGDIIFQLFSILVLIFFIVMIVLLIVFFVRSSKRRNEQLNRIEEKLDRASGQTQKEKL